MEIMTTRRVHPLFFCLALAGAFALGSWSHRHSETTSSDGTRTVYSPAARSALMAQVREQLKDGDYLFLPNRRSVWVVNRTNGRVANYHFLNNEYETVERSRVGQVDTRTFPPEDTLYEISDRNLSNNLWVCNVRTGDVQLWTVSHDREFKRVGPIATSTDLMTRN